MGAPAPSRVPESSDEPSEALHARPSSAPEAHHDRSAPAAATHKIDCSLTSSSHATSTTDFPPRPDPARADETLPDTPSVPSDLLLRRPESRNQTYGTGGTALYAACPWLLQSSGQAIAPPQPERPARQADGHRSQLTGPPAAPSTKSPLTAATASRRKAEVLPRPASVATAAFHEIRVIF